MLVKRSRHKADHALTDLLICGSAPEIYRLSLSEGRFLTPLPLRSPAANACALSPAHGLFGAAGEDGCLECFDLRQRSSVGRVDVASAADSVRAGSWRLSPRRSSQNLRPTLCSIPPDCGSVDRKPEILDVDAENA